MAGQDEDWQAFLNATEEDDEEVETSTEEEDEPEVPAGDKKKPADKSEEDEDEEPSGDEEDSEEEDDPEEEDEDGKKKSDPKAYTPRLKQFFDKDGNLDPAKIEDAYIKSGKQAVDLNKKLEDMTGKYGELIEAIKGKPEVAEALFGKEGAKKLGAATPKGDGGGSEGDPLADHPLIQHLQATMTKDSRKEYDEFVDAHPEAVTDPEKVEKIGDFLKFYGSHYRATNDGAIPSMKESLEAAYRFHGWDLEGKDEEVVTAAKKAAATRRTPGGGPKKASKSEVSKGEQFFASKLGVKLKS